MPRSTKRTNSSLSASKQSIPPAPRQSIPPPKQSVPPTSLPVYNPPSMLDTIKQGFFFGAGSSIAHNIFNSNSKNTKETINTSEPKLINEPKLISEPKLSSDKVFELYTKCLEKKDNTINCNLILENA
jgi:hypothetical protein